MTAPPPLKQRALRRVAERLRASPPPPDASASSIIELLEEEAKAAAVHPRVDRRRTRLLPVRVVLRSEETVLREARRRVLYLSYWWHELKAGFRFGREALAQLAVVFASAADRVGRWWRAVAWPRVRRAGAWSVDAGAGGLAAIAVGLRRLGAAIRRSRARRAPSKTFGDGRPPVPGPRPISAAEHPTDAWLQPLGRAITPAAPAYEEADSRELTAVVWRSVARAREASAARARESSQPR